MIATRLKWYLDVHGICYEVVHHAHDDTSLGCARAAHVPGGRVVKCVLLEDERGYLLAVLPASCRLELPRLRKQLKRDLQLASEAELGLVFGDCETGAVPPLGDAYGIPTLTDECLLRLPDVYFEAGDHEDLVHLSGSAFRALLSGGQHGRFSRPH